MDGLWCLHADRSASNLGLVKLFRVRVIDGLTAGRQEKRASNGEPIALIERLPHGEVGSLLFAAQLTPRRWISS